MSYALVWFKRDLRVEDHAPLAHAAAQGPLMCLYIVEPSVWAQPDAAGQHYEFLLECLQDLAEQLARLGLRLQLVRGEPVDVLSRLRQQAPFHTLMSHQETGNAHSYARDRAVARWCREQGVRWHEWPQQGVVRRLPSRDLWLAQWQDFMGARPWPSPAPGATQGRIWTAATECWPSTTELGLPSPPVPQRQRGGRHRAQQVLRDFLDERSAMYRGGLSSPLTAPSACSRLSPYLAWGCLSVREVVQATRERLRALADRPDPLAQRQRQGLQAFLSRLHWQGHFIQKLESEPALEFRCLHPGYEDLRDPEAHPDRLAALMQGRTGWPLVDACVAMLRETGWINFRMRAMLVSVAAYPLWLHWRPVGLWLARQFLDYEPGIHWPQLQMQSGTTGINATRIYNPLKQAQDQDPEGRFVRRWLPALRRVPDAWLAQPWRMPASVQARCGVRVGQDIAEPLLDLEQALREARERIHARRAQAEVRAARAALVEKHASRSPWRDTRATRAPRADARQQCLDF